MSDPQLRPRDFVQVPHRDKVRSMIVLHVDGLRFIAISGTGTLRDLPGETVEPNTKDGKGLDLYKPTRFYFAGLHIVNIHLVKPAPRRLRCSPELWLKINAGVESFLNNAIELMLHNPERGDPAYDVPNIVGHGTTIRGRRGPIDTE